MLGKLLSFLLSFRGSHDPAVEFSLNVAKLFLVLAAVFIGFSILGYALKAALYVLGVIVVAFCGYKLADSVGLINRNKNNLPDRISDDF